MQLTLAIGEVGSRSFQKAIAALDALPPLMKRRIRPIRSVRDTAMAAFHTQLLTIQGMQGEDAVHGVTHVLGLLPGVRINSVDIGQARVLAEPEG